MKLGTAFALLLGLSCTLIAQTPPPVLPTSTSVNETPPPATQVAALVNNQEIPEKAVWRALRQFPKDDQAVARKEILDHLIENTLIDQYLTALKVSVQPSEVDKLIEELKGELAKSGKKYEDELKNMFLTESEFRKEVEAQMKWDKFLKDQGTDTALEKMFNAAPTMFDGTMVRARHILLTPTDDVSKAEAAKKLRELKASIETEVNKYLATMPATTNPLDKERKKLEKVQELFAKMAMDHSKCPSKKDGGDLNFFSRVGMMVEPFSKAAFDLKVGDMSDVVATEFGYHLILVTARNPGKQPTFTQVKEGVRAVYAMRLRDAVIAQMKPKATIKITTAK